MAYHVFLNTLFSKANHFSSWTKDQKIVFTKLDITHIWEIHVSCVIEFLQLHCEDNEIMFLEMFKYRTDNNDINTS